VLKKNYFQTYVASVVSECLKSRLSVASSSSPSAATPRCLLLLLASAGHPPSPSSLIDASEVRDSHGPTRARKTIWKNNYRRGRPKSLSSRRPDASKLLIFWGVHFLIRRAICGMYLLRSKYFLLCPSRVFAPPNITSITQSLAYILVLDLCCYLNHQN
jgi:hypothetical protein